LVLSGGNYPRLKDRVRSPLSARPNLLGDGLSDILDPRRRSAV
jgi:hypothetical protein